MSADNGKILQSDLLCFTPWGLDIIKKEVRLKALQDAISAVDAERKVVLEQELRHEAIGLSWGKKAIQTLIDEATK